jgi:23S rRNA (pseudouridine1915-N3)-methyltransferase
MKIIVAAIGKAKATSPEMALFAEYQKRLGWKLTLKEFDIKPTSKDKEGAALLAACTGAGRMIALDEYGKALSSREFAAQIAIYQQQGISHIGFVIGGADGLAETVKKQAHLTLSFGKATWPHMLVRSMLAEQLYRAQMILDGHPYHRD